MAALEFFFSIDCSDQAASRELLAEVITRVGALAGPAANGPLKGVYVALDQCAARGQLQCRVTFQARDGRLVVAVATTTGQIWQVTESLA